MNLIMLISTGLIALSCLVGLWHMKKWAAYTYAGLFTVNLIAVLTVGGWNILTLIIPGIMTFFALKNVPQMS